MNIEATSSIRPPESLCEALSLLKEIGKNPTVNGRAYLTIPMDTSDTAARLRQAMRWGESASVEQIFVLLEQEIDAYLSGGTTNER